MKFSGWLSIGIIFSVYMIAVSGLFTEIELTQFDFNLNQSYLLKIIKFSLLQAGLSTLLSIGLAIPVARALHRQQFKGKQILLMICGLSLVLPVIVAILGIVSVHGNTGWISKLLLIMDIEADYLYGLSGILIAHVFFNLPLASRIFLTGLNTIPSSSWRLASHLGMNSTGCFRFIEWPLLKAQLPQLAGLIFLLCFTSFAIVLVFGGGLKYSTLEVAIYQSIRFDFDIPKAVLLSLIQIFVCAFVFFFIIRQSSDFNLQNLSEISVVRVDGKDLKTRIFDALVLLIFILWVILPLLAIATGALNLSAWSIINTDGFYQALKGSLLISMSSAAIAAAIVLSICYFYKSVKLKKLTTHFLELSIQLILIFPPFVLATGLFIIFKGKISFIGPVIVIIINVLAVLPFMMRILLPAVLFTQRYDQLSQSLGIVKLNRLIQIDWLIIKKSFALALGVGLALSIGDFSVIALFGSQNFQTLPLYLYRLMGAYRVEQAGIIAIVICTLSLLAFFLSQKLLGVKHVKT